MNLKRGYDSRNVKYYLLLIEGRFHLSLIFLCWTAYSFQTKSDTEIFEVSVANYSILIQGQGFKNLFFLSSYG